MELRPLTVGDVLDCSMEITWRKALFILGLSVVIQCPLYFVIDLFLKCIVTCVHSLGTSDAATMGTLAMLPLFLVLVLFYYFTKGAVSIVTGAEVMCRPAGFFSVIGQALGKFGRLSGAGVITTLFSLILVIIPVSLSISAYVEGKYIVQSLSFIFILSCFSSILWMLLMVRLCLAVPAVVIEGRGVVDALKRSWSLSGRYWWKCWVVWFLFNGMISLGGLCLLVYIGSKALVYFMIMLPLATVAESVLLFDIKVREEAYDLEFQTYLRRKELEDSKDG